MSYYGKFYSTIRKFEFKDTMIVPKKSYIKSRKNVNLEREFIFKTPTKNVSWK